MKITLDKAHELLEAMGYEVVEQAEQRSDSERMEPVGWARTSESGEVLDCISHTYKITQPCTVDYDEPLYAAPVRTKDLTDDEIDQIRIKSGKEKISLVYFARAVIAADRSKNGIV